MGAVWQLSAAVAEALPWAASQASLCRTVSGDVRGS